MRNIVSSSDVVVQRLGDRCSWQEMTSSSLWLGFRIFCNVDCNRSESARAQSRDREDCRCRRCLHVVVVAAVGVVVVVVVVLVVFMRHKGLEDGKLVAFYVPSKLRVGSIKTEARRI